MPEYTEAEKIQFRQEVDARRRAGRKIDPIMRCTTVGCGYQCTESYAKQVGLRSCPQCGNSQVVISTLDYNPQVPANPLPTVQEAERMSRSQRPWVR